MSLASAEPTADLADLYATILTWRPKLQPTKKPAEGESAGASGSGGAHGGGPTSIIRSSPVSVNHNHSDREESRR